MEKEVVAQAADIKRRAEELQKRVVAYSELQNENTLLKGDLQTHRCEDKHHPENRAPIRISCDEPRAPDANFHFPPRPHRAPSSETPRCTYQAATYPTAWDP